MNEILQKTTKAKHIVVIAHNNADSLSSASAMYTHLLMLHKKVSFFCANKTINEKYAFIPWFSKIRNSFPSSADLAISFDSDPTNQLCKDSECDLINIENNEKNIQFTSSSYVLYNYFKNNNIQINKKMATALYSGLLEISEGFLSNNVDAKFFTILSELIELGAEQKLCNKFIIKYQTLAGLRLKAIMLTKMKLYFDAKLAVFLLTHEDMQKSGAFFGECKIPLKEALSLPTVEVAFLIKENADLSLEVTLYSNGVFNASSIAIYFECNGNQSRAEFNLSSRYTLQSASEEILQLINKEI